MHLETAARACHHVLALLVVRRLDADMVEVVEPLPQVRDPFRQIGVLPVHLAQKTMAFSGSAFCRDA